jgi:PAS domain S-box-containing protein
MITSPTKSRPAVNRTDKIYFVQTDEQLKILSANASFSLLINQSTNNLYQAKLSDYFNELDVFEIEKLLKDTGQTNLIEITLSIKPDTSAEIVINWQLTTIVNNETNQSIYNWLGREVILKSVFNTVNTETDLSSYHYFFQNSPQPMWVFDVQTLNFLDVNEAALSFYGYSKQEFLSMKLLDIRPETEVSKTIESVNEFLTGENKSTDKGIWIHKKKSGELCNMHIYIHQVRVNGRKALLSQLSNETLIVKAEDALKRSKERFDSFLAQSTEGIWCFELDIPIEISKSNTEIIRHCISTGKLVDCNDAFANMYGLESRDQFIGVPLYQMISLENPKNLAYLNEFVNTGFNLENAESIETDANGTTKIFLNNLKGIIEEGKLKRAWGTQRDVTEQRGIENKDKYLASLMEAAEDIVISQDKELNVVSWNKVAEQTYGYTAEEMIGRKVQDALHFNYHNISRETFFNELETKGSWKGEATVINRWGEAITVLASATQIKDEKGDISGLLSISKNITDRIKSERSAKFRSEILENLSDGVIFKGRDYKIVEFNKAAESQFGITKQQVIGKRIKDVLTYSFGEISSEEVLQKVHANGNWKGEMKFIHPKLGVEKILQVSMTEYFNELKEPIGTVLLTKDITDQKIIEEKIKETEERFRIMADTAPVMIWMTNEKDDTIYVNKCWTDYTGIKLSENLSFSWNNLIYIDDRETGILNYNECFLRRQPVSMSYRLKNRTGQYRWVYDNAVPRFLDDGTFIGYIGSVIDIHESKIAEGKLQYQARLLQDISDAVVSTDLVDYNILTWNKAAEKIYNVKASEAVGKKLRDLIKYDFQGASQEQLVAEFIKIGKWEGEVSFIRNDGQKIYLFASVSAINNEKGEKIGAVAVNRDITERTNVLKALRKKETEFRTLAENAPTLIQRVDKNLRFVYVNSAFLELFNLDLSNVIGKSFNDIGFSDKMVSKFLTTTERVKKSRQSFTYTSHAMLGSNSEWDFLITVTPEFNEEKELESFLILINNITEIEDVKKNLETKEKQLLQSNKRFELATKATTDSIWELDVSTGYVFITKEFTQLFGYVQEELINKSTSWYIERIHPEDRLSVISKMTQSFTNKDEFWRDEYRWMAKDGTYIYIFNQAYVFYDGNGIPYKGIGAIKDITERKKAESLLIQKDILLAASAQAANQLLIEADSDKAFYKGLQIVGQAAKADRSYLFKVLPSNGVSNTYKQLLEWNSGMYDSQMDNPELEAIQEEEYPEIFEGLAEGKPRQLAFSQIQKDALKKHWQQQEIKSLLLVPVFVNNNYWGFIGFDQCSYERSWLNVEIDILQAFSSNISGAIEKQQAKRSLMESEIKFKSLFQNSLDIVFVLNEECILKFVTPSVTAILGYTDISVSGLNGFDFIHKDDLTRAKNSFQELLDAPDTSVITDLRVKTKEGDWLWVEAKGINRLNDNIINGIIVSFRDISERKQSEQQLQHYSENITNILNSITDGFIAFDYEYRVLWWNPIAEQLTGIRDMDILGKNLWEALPELRETISFEEYNKVLETKTVSNFEMFVPGLKVFFDVNAYPSKQGLFVYFKDITVRKKQEMLLALEKEVLELNANPASTLKNVLDYFLEGLEKINYGALYSILQLNDDSATIKHLSAPSISGQYMQMIDGLAIGPNVGSCGTCMYYSKEVIVSDIQTDTLWKDYKDLAERFELRACWSFPIISSSNKVLGSLAAYYKKIKQPSLPMIQLLKRVAALSGVIIENKQAEEKINISNERYLLATKATNDAIWDFDIKNNHLYWGESFYALFGYKQSDIDRREGFWESKIHPEDRRRTVGIYQTALKKKDHSIIHIDYRFKKADGKYALISDRSFVVYDNKGEPTRIVGSMQDVTERKKLEKKLLTQEIEKQKSIAQAVVDAQEKERGEIGKELHDNVNQILSTAKLYLELAKTESKQRPELIKRSADNIFDAINEIRAISKALVPPSVKDLGLIDSIKDMIESLHIAKAIKVKFTHKNYKEEEVGDNVKLMLFRIVQEQVNNILKHAEAKLLIITISIKDKYIQLQLSDNGKGFDPEKIKFKKGVGLTNIESRANLLNGKVTIQSTVGKGTVLTVDVPIHKL